MLPGWCRPPFQRLPALQSVHLRAPAPAGRLSQFPFLSETEPGFKGDTATGANKPATVETGATVYVPLFVEIGDKIKIDTRTGEYLSRV